MWTPCRLPWHSCWEWSLCSDTLLALSPGSTTELEQISLLWAAGMQYAWLLPTSSASGIQCLSSPFGGQQTPCAHEIYLQSIFMTWTVNQLHADDLLVLTEQDRLHTLQVHNCLKAAQLQTCLSLSPFTAPRTMMERLVVGCDNIGIEVQDPHPPA